MFTFIFHIDPGHGWLEVPECIVKALNVRVSQYSYKYGDKLYLEEDCDALRFDKAIKEAGIKYHTISMRYAESAPIRNYQRCS